MSDSVPLAAQPPDEPSARSPKWRVIGGLASVAISGTLLYILLRDSEVWNVLAASRGTMLLVAAAFSISINVFLGAWKWRIVTGLLKIRVSYWRIWRLWAGLSITTFMPFQSGHLVYALALNRAEKTGFAPAFESVVYDRYLTLVGTLLLAAVGQVLIDDSHTLAHPLLLAIASLGVLFFCFDHLLLGRLGQIPFLRRRCLLNTSPSPRD